MYCQPSELLQCITASDLLTALSTLKQLSKPIQTDHDSSEGRRPIDFSTYMQKKKKSNHNHNQLRKQPLQDKNINTHKTNDLNKSYQLRKTLSPIHQKQNSLNKLSTVRNRNIDEKSNKKENNQAKKINQKKSTKVLLPESQTHISVQSKKILKQNSDQGKHYVPIQFRTNDFLKNKQQKIAKMQRQEQNRKLIMTKECTFKPKIIEWKKPAFLNTVPERQCNEKDQQQNQIQNQEEHKNQIIEVNQNKTNEIDRKQKNISNQQSISVICPAAINKQKNKKFNFLLDLIH